MNLLLDVRPEARFLEGHEPGAVGIPFEELPGRVHELPRAGRAIVVMDADAERARAAAEFLQRRGHPTTVALFNPARQTERGPSRHRLWEPNPFLVEALAIAQVPLPRRALDVACGTGRDAVYLATQGFDVEAIDVLPDAVARAEDLARRYGVRIRGHVKDLAGDPSLPGMSFELVTVFRFLQRSLWPAIRSAVVPGGYVIYETFHERNRQTGHRPQSPDHLLKTGELEAASGGFEIMLAHNEVEREGRYYSNLLARRSE